MIPVSAPPRVRTRLRNAPNGPVPVVHHGPDAVYVDVDGWCVGVVGFRATAVPCALRTSLATLPVISGAGIRDGVLHLDDVPLAIGRLADVSVPHLRATGPGGGLSPADVAEMVGRGDGLTPYGDDVLCGWLATHRAAGVATPDVDEAVRAHLSRTTLLSATLLDCAHARRGHPRVRGLPRRPRHSRRDRARPRRSPPSDTPQDVACSREPASRWTTWRWSRHDRWTEPRRAPPRRVRRLGDAAAGQPDRAGRRRGRGRPGGDGDPAQRRGPHRDGVHGPGRGRAQRHGRGHPARRRR